MFAGAIIPAALLIEPIDPGVPPASGVVGAALAVLAAVAVAAVEAAFFAAPQPVTNTANATSAVSFESDFIVVLPPKRESLANEAPGDSSSSLSRANLEIAGFADKNAPPAHKRCLNP